MNWKVALIALALGAGIGGLMAESKRTQKAFFFLMFAVPAVFMALRGATGAALFLTGEEKITRRLGLDVAPMDGT